jgi:hypothetical protein
MNLKDFHPFTEKVSLWCCEQDYLTRFSLHVDPTTKALVVTIEWIDNKKTCQLEYMFSYTMVKMSWDAVLIQAIINKIKQVRP